MPEEEKQEVEKPEPEQKEPIVAEEPISKKAEETIEEPSKKGTSQVPPPTKVDSGEKKPQAPTERIKATNCTQCNKPLKRGMWYYRNGKFYCNKRCWKKSTEKVA